MKIQSQNSKKVILSLFDYSGNWSQPYADHGYHVVLVDLKHGKDIFKVLDDLMFTTLKVYGILAAPPCTDFSTSGAQYWKLKDEDGRTEKSLNLVRETLKIIKHFDPVFWAIENPVGRLHLLLPELGKAWYFQPYWYGDPYSKKTGLWGKFNKPWPTNIVEPLWIEAKTGSGRKYNAVTWSTGGTSEKTKELRSITPKGFANVFFIANQ